MPHVPLSHPFVERLIGTIRRECLDRTLFWTAADLERKLLDFQRYYNGHRVHAGLNGRTPDPSADQGCARASVSSYRWQASVQFDNRDSVQRPCVHQQDACPWRIDRLLNISWVSRAG